jgi:hypothetical protein
LSETAEQRTKRRFIEYLDLTTWTHQYSFFYQCAEDARACALSDTTKLKEKLRRTKALKSQPFLYRLCLYRANAFHTIFTNEAIKVGLLESIICKTSGAELKVVGRELPEWKIERYRHAVSKKPPHNLKGFFGDKKINRIALLNVKKIS